MPKAFKEFRCPYCDKRLLDYSDGEKFNISCKCPRCKVIITIKKI